MPDVTPIPLSRLTTLRTGGTPERMIDAPTTAELVGGVPGIVIDAKAEQRYLVPVLYTASYRAKASAPSMRFSALRKAVDEAKREPLQIPGVLPR